jgi:ketosteroid isomerase-like protein
MSRENVELVQRGWDAFLEGGIEAAFEFYAEDCEIADPPDVPDPETRHGREGLKAIVDRFADLWEDLSMTPTEFIDAGDDHVVVVVAMTGSGKESGIPLPDTTPLVCLYDIEDGLIVRQRNFLSRERALQEAEGRRGG